MKKTCFIVLTVLLAAMVAACGSVPAPVPAAAPMQSGIYPPLINAAVGMNAPEDVLVGIGNAKLANMSQSRTFAANRARAEISRQMNSMVQDMLTDYQAGSEADPSASLAYQESITVTLSKSQLTGARVVVEDKDADGQIWCVVYLDKNGVAREINQAAAAAKLAVPKMAAFDAEARMDKAFGKIAAEEAAAVK